MTSHTIPQESPSDRDYSSPNRKWIAPVLQLIEDISIEGGTVAIAETQNGIIS